MKEEEIAGYFPTVSNDTGYPVSDNPVVTVYPAVSGNPGSGYAGGVDPEVDATTDQKKLTQLREYLQKSLKSPIG